MLGLLLCPQAIPKDIALGDGAAVAGDGGLMTVLDAGLQLRDQRLEAIGDPDANRGGVRVIVEEIHQATSSLRSLRVGISRPLLDSTRRFSSGFIQLMSIGPMPKSILSGPRGA